MWRMMPALLAAALAAAFLACGDDDDSSGPAGSPTSGAQGTAGTIVVSSSPITGQNGRMLLISAGSPGGPAVAGACVPITSDRFAVPPTVLTDAQAGGDPCGPAGAQAVFAAGTYSISAGVYAPPAQQPEKQTTMSVQARGDAPNTVNLDSAALSR